MYLLNLAKVTSFLVLAIGLTTSWQQKAHAEDVDITITHVGGAAFDVLIDGPLLWNWDLVCLGDEFSNCLYCVEAEGKCPDSVVLCEFGDKTVGEVRNCNGKVEHDGVGKIERRSRNGASGTMTEGDGKGHSFSVKYQ